MRKIISLVTIILLFSGLVVLTGCEKEIELNKNEVNEIIENYKEDAIITKTMYGGECSEDYEYYIFINKNKIIEHEKFTIYPMTSKEDAKPTESKYTKKEYNVDKTLMNELKNIINEAKDKNEQFGTTMDYKIKIDDQVYGIENQKRVKEIFDKIKGKE